MRRPWAVPLALILTLLAGCSSPEGDSPRSGTTASPSPTTVAATSGTSTTDVPTASAHGHGFLDGPPPNAGPVHAAGGPGPSGDGNIMTVYAWQRVQRPGRAAAGAWWAGDVKVCITPDFGDGSTARRGTSGPSFRAELADDRP